MFIIIYVHNNPLGLVDPSGLATTGKRPLGGGSTIPPYIVPINDWANNEPVHEHIWFDAPVELTINGQKQTVTNVGFSSSGNPIIDKGMILIEPDSDKSRYNLSGITYNDEAMRQSVQSLIDNSYGDSTYVLWGNNCQNFVEDARNGIAP